MKKLLGAVCVLLGGAWAWRAQLSAARRRRDTLAGLTAGLGQMEIGRASCRERV